jgi:hypothetical protein
MAALSHKQLCSVHRRLINGSFSSLDGCFVSGCCVNGPFCKQVTQIQAASEARMEEFLETQDDVRDDFVGEMIYRSAGTLHLTLEISNPKKKSLMYFTRKRTPQGPYCRPMPRVLRGSQGGGRFLMGEVPLCCSGETDSGPCLINSRSLNPEPETLHPTPLNLNPEPQPLNPKPETLNPEP